MAERAPAGLRPLQEARADVMAAVRPLGAESAAIWEASDRVMAEDVIAAESVPSFENSAMDGFAVRASDVAKPGRVLRIVADLRAGSSLDRPVEQGEAVRIMTGAPMPPGADTVVKVEDTSAVEGMVTIGPAVPAGTAVRAAGGDVQAGQHLFSKGTRLTPMHIGVLATLGMATPKVTRRPRVAFMSTGDELAPIEAGSLGPGKIRDSNRPMLAALLRDAHVEPVDLGVVADDEAALREALDEAGQCDVIVTTGGVSMGDYDVTKALLSKGSGVEFWRIAMQPGKPFAFGRIGDSLFFGLPGNPVSVVVSFEQLVRPALMKMQGSSAVFRPRTLAVADEELATDPEKTVFTRVRINRNVGGRIHVVTSGGQASNVLSAAAAADALAVTPTGTGTVPVGEDVMIELLHSPEVRREQDV